MKSERAETDYCNFFHFFLFFFFDFVFCLFVFFKKEGDGCLSRMSNSHCSRGYLIDFNNIFDVSVLITRLIVSDIAPWTVLLCNCPLLKVLVLIQSVCWFGVINIEINIGHDRDGPLQLIFVDLFWLICTYKICKVFTHTPKLNNSFFKLTRSLV